MEDGGRTAERNGTEVTHKESPAHGAPSNNEEGASRDFSIDVSMLHSGEPHTNNSRDHIMSGFPSLEQDHFPVILRPENAIAVELRTSSSLGNVGETQNTAPKNRKFTGAGISGNPTLDMPQNAAGLKLARKYYLITWVIFLVVFSLCVGLEIGLIYMCNLRSAEITYARMVPLMNHMGVVLARLQSGSGRSSDLLRDLMAMRSRLIEEFDRTQPYDNQIFWVNCYISSVLFGVLCVVAALCVKFRHHQSVKSRGRFFLVQYFVGASGALIFSVLTLANITHNLLDSNPLNPREYKSMEDLAIRQEQWANISIGLTAGAGLFVSILCSAYLQRQRLIHELFVGTLRVRGVPTTWEYFKMAPLAIFTTLLVVSGAIVAKYFYYSPERGYNFNGIHAQYAGFWAYPVIYVSGILYY